MGCRFSVQPPLHPSADLLRSQRTVLTARRLSHLRCHKKYKTPVFDWPIVIKTNNNKEKCKWKNQCHFHVSFLVYVLHYKQCGVGLPVFSVAIKNIITAYKHSGTLEEGAELWVASASALLMNPSDAVSSEGTARTEHSLQSSVPCRVLQGSVPRLCHSPIFILCVDEGVQLRLRECVWYVQCCVTSLGNWYSSFLHFQWTRNLKFRTILH